MNSRLTRVVRKILLAPVLARVRPRVTTMANGRPMRIDLRDQVLARFLFATGRYEAELQKFWSLLDLAGGTCLDVGANIGLHSVALSGLVGPAGRVLAFEPDANNYELLRHNLGRNGCRNVEAAHVAVGDREGTCLVVRNHGNHGDHRVIAGRGTTPITTIDAATRDLPHGAVKLIKIDVQGHEPCVVRGMAETLDRNPSAVVCVEVFPDGLRDQGGSASGLVRQLYDLGLSGWEFHDMRAAPAGEPWIYELLRWGNVADLILSRDRPLIDGAMERFFGADWPASRGGTNGRRHAAKWECQIEQGGLGLSYD